MYIGNLIKTLKSNIRIRYLRNPYHRICGYLHHSISISGQNAVKRAIELAEVLLDDIDIIYIGQPTINDYRTFTKPIRALQNLENLSEMHKLSPTLNKLFIFDNWENYDEQTIGNISRLMMISRHVRSTVLVIGDTRHIRPVIRQCSIHYKGEFSI
jgi:hypothetical protein